VNLSGWAHVRDRLAAERVLRQRGMTNLLRAHLARHKIPRDVVFIDALPRNETGKVLRKKLFEN
jgi:acyl-CoA synthetase (AMP-forming)/AMP-acid ligase II